MSLQGDGNNIDVSLLQRQFAKLKETQDAEPSGSGKGSGPPHVPPMSDEGKIGRLEGEVGGLKHGQTQLLVAVGLVAAFVVGFGIYTLQRIDNLADKVNDLPGKISSELRDVTKTLADGITAAKQTPPQVILMPAPQLPPPQVPAPQPPK
jgi:hypothetical protein